MKYGGYFLVQERTRTGAFLKKHLAVSLSTGPQPDSLLGHNIRHWPVNLSSTYPKRKYKMQCSLVSL